MQRNSQQAVSEQPGLYTVLLCLGAAVISSCQPITPQQRIDRIGTVFGDEDVSYVVGTDSDRLPLSQMVVVAETLGVYKRLNASEAEKIRALAQKSLDGFVLGEMRVLAPQFEKRRNEVRSQTRRALAGVDDPGEIDRIRSAETDSLEAINRDWKRSAVINVTRKFGSELAVPLRTYDRKPVVAVTAIRDGQVLPPRVSFELSQELDVKADPNADQPPTVRHRKGNAVLIESAVDLDPKP